MSGAGTIETPAFAKLNLTLDILRRREDGYHDLSMVMQTISLCDTLTVTARARGIAVHTEGAALPDGPGNLAYRAAQAFFTATGLAGGAEITVRKRIPACAGMAGGSADAAAVLRALRTLYAPALAQSALERIGETVGSDVPFCVRGGTALAEGRGERLTALPPMPACYLAVCKPDFDLPTPALFARVRAEAIRRRPAQTAMTAALAAGDPGAVAANLCNVFEEFLRAAEAAEIAAIRETMGRCGALGTAMTGSGPTVFGVFREEAAARAAERALRGQYGQVFLANPVQP